MMIFSFKRFSSCVIIISILGNEIKTRATSKKNYVTVSLASLSWLSLPQDVYICSFSRTISPLSMQLSTSDACQWDTLSQETNGPDPLIACDLATCPFKTSTTMWGPIVGIHSTTSVFSEYVRFAIPSFRGKLNNYPLQWIGKYGSQLKPCKRFP